MKSGFVTEENISYGSHERHRLDIFYPEKIRCYSGVILFIHGGGWSDGDKSAHYEDAEYFSSEGYITAVMNYRFVTDTINVFDELDDITAALQEIKKKCTDKGIELQKLLLSGGSAGAHLALLYAYLRSDEAPIRPSCVCAYCPPVNCSAEDFLLGISGEFEDWKYGVLSKCCGEKITKATFQHEKQSSALRKISPVEYVSASCVPTAVFHGRHDELVPYRHAEYFIEKLSGNGIDNRLLVYENSGHDMKSDPDTAALSRKIITEFAEKYIK